MATTPLLDYSLFTLCLPFLALSLIVFLLANRPTSASRKALRLPPGPRGWPVVGNLFQVAFSGKSFMHYARDLREIYGPIFTLKMGTRTLIIVSSPELAHEALVKRGQLFASRPPENPTRTIFSCDKFTVNSSVYGPVWRSLRRNMVSGMLSASRLRELRPIRERAMDIFVEHIRKEADANGGAFAVLKNARFAVFCILLAMCFGLDLDEETNVKVDQLLKKVLLSLNPRIDDYLPILSPFFKRQMEQALNVRKEQIETLVPLIERRRAMLRSQKVSPSDEYSFSYLDSLLDLRVEGRDSPPSDEELVSLCSEFLNGGTDTTATSIEWGVARLIDNPKIQARLHAEIKLVVGEGRKVDEKDTERMPYLQAFVKEVLRKHPPTHFSLTHAALEDTELAGYDVPKDVNVEFYLPGIAEDPRLWKDPAEFRPERFVEGGEDGDMTGNAGARMLPFGAGRRICPGLAMAVLHVHLMVARLVQEFELVAHESQPKMDFSEKLDFTVVMKRPLVAAVRPRRA